MSTLIPVAFLSKVIDNNMVEKKEYKNYNIVIIYGKGVKL